MLTNSDMADIVLSLGGDPDNSTNVRQLEVMLDALKIYFERNEARKDLWMTDTLDESAMHCISKAKRIQNAPYDEKSVDDGLDLINYTVFFLRNRAAVVAVGDLMGPPS